MTVKVSLRYGNEKVEAVIPSGRFIGELKPNFLPAVADLDQEVRNALGRPIGCEPLNILTQKVQRAAVVISDHTRLLPSGSILPLLCNEFELAGLKKDDITVIIGVGNHRPVTEQEKETLLGSLYGQVKCVHSKETGYSVLGRTKRGTPVEVAVPIAEADLVVALGTIELHQLAGYSGGAKAIAAGAASHRALEHNHRLSVLKENSLGLVRGNMVRQDMEEFARIANLGFIINVVLNELQQVVNLVAGDPVLAHRAGCMTAHALYTVPIEEVADIVIVSPGGEPKDSTVYQAQKCVKNALQAVDEGGIIIVAAKCGEGFGDPVFEQWINQASKPEDIARRTSQEFVLGGHKGVFIAQAVNKARVFWVSDMEPKKVRKLFFEPFSSLQKAVDSALEIKGDRAGVLAMPWGGLTVPYKNFN